jgi:hypothetical protein
MMLKKILTTCFIFIIAVLPVRASQHFDVYYRIKDVQKVDAGYQATLSITIHNHSAQAYQAVTLVPENIHLVLTDSYDNQMVINMVPAQNFIRHNWTINTALPLDSVENGQLYFHLTAIDNMGNQVSFPIRAVRGGH